MPPLFFCCFELDCETGLVKRTSHKHWVHVAGTDFDLIEWDEVFFPSSVPVINLPPYSFSLPQRTRESVSQTPRRQNPLRPKFAASVRSQGPGAGHVPPARWSTVSSAAPSPQGVARFAEVGHRAFFLRGEDQEGELLSRVCSRICGGLRFSLGVLWCSVGHGSAAATGGGRWTG